MQRAGRHYQRWLGLSLCLVLVLSSFFVAPLSLVKGQGKSQAKRPALQRPGELPSVKAHKVNPAPPEKGPGRPNLPNLNELKRRQPPAPQAPVSVPSAMRSRRKPLESMGGKKVGDTGTTGGPISKEKNGKTPSEIYGRSHHSRRRTPVAAPLPPTPDDQYISNFIYYALGRGITGTESTYWTDIARSAYAQGPNSMLVAMRELGRTIFESAEYAARPDRDCSNSTNSHNYVQDLYETYLMRSPDQGGWDFWSGQCQAYGKEQVRAAFDQSGEFYNDVTSLTPNGSISGNVGSISSARIDLFNQSGDQTGARDCEWSLSLLSLTGRAGLDLGLGLSYSSLAWTPSGPYLYFDEDHGSPSPGFHLGFATVQWLAFDPQSQRNVYVVVTSAGRRIALRQVGSSNTYEAADSSHLQLTDNGSYLLLRSTDGTQITYSSYANEWCATQVKDRNGNYLTMTNDWRGDIQNITDTLGRVINFIYDGNANLSSIAQNWNGNWHYLATFGFGASLSMNVSGFTGTSVVGTYTGEQIPVLRQVGLADGTYYTFDYSAAGQVSLIRHYRSDNYSNNYVAYDYDNSASDCPRITQTRVWADSWTGSNGVPYEVTTQFNLPGDGSHQMVTPDGTTYREYYGSGWQHGLVTLSQVYSGGLQKWTTINYTQDNTGVNYQTNPRVTETNVYDASGNRRRTTIDYQGSFGLPWIVTDYAADAASVIRRTYFDYIGDSPYIDRRIIGLLFRRTVYDGSWNLLAKTEYYYDWGAEHMQNTAASPIQHDPGYDVNFLPRGNVVDVAQFDATDPNNGSKVHEFKYGYDIAGNVTFTRDPLWHQNFISYSDSFSDGGNRNSFAYPTTVTNADGYSSYVQYNYDFGAKTQIQTPQPNTTSNTPGPVQTYSYDGVGRLYQVATSATGAYVHFFYGSYYSYTLSTTNNVADEAYAIQVFDGMGRVMQAATNNPGSSGGYKASWTQFDAMGRVIKRSNPTEIDGNWNPYGDDSSGRLYTQQTYDWKGRPLITTNQDGTQKYASYNGCGCAGGEVATITDEGGRQRKVYSDVLGRNWKTEFLNWNGTVYSTAENTFNALDEVTLVRQVQGPDYSAVYQDTTMSYDGYARLQTKHVPEQNAGTATVYTYNADDTLYSVTDARGASATYGYNGRHLFTSINYAAPEGIPASPNASFTFDGAGNRIAMSDGLGSKSYSYNELSQMTSETRYFNALGQYFTFSYDYNLSGEVKKITDATGMTINYGYDAIGRVNSVTGSDNLYAGVWNYASNFQYRAWGGLKAFTDGTDHVTSLGYNNRLQPSQLDISGSVVSQNYDYYNDGRIAFVHNTTDANFDRSYAYDHVGRLVENKTGGQARSTADTSPYYESFGYDAFGNLNSRETQTWNGFTDDSDGAGYTNNRRDGWGYDADGRNTTIDTRTYSYDAAGRQALMTAQRVLWNGNHVAVNQSSGYDGDGAKASDTKSGVTTYYLASSVLGRKVIEEIDSSGQKSVGYVYLGGELLASQTHGYPSDQVTWKHNSRTSLYETNSNSTYVARTEFDPMGANVQLEQPPDPPPSEGEGDVGNNFGGNLMGRFANMFNLAGGCVSSISDASCSQVVSAQGYLDAQTQAFFGYQWYDLPGNANEAAQGEERYLSIMGSGYDPAFGHYWGTYSLTVNGVAVQTIKNPTLDQLANLNATAAAYEVGYGPDSGNSDENTHDISTPSVVNIFGGAQYLVAQNSTQTSQPFDWALFWDLLTAEKALQKKSCRDLFGSNVDPGKLLASIAAGNAGLGSITRGDLGAPSNGTVTAADTTGILGSKTVTLPNGNTVKQSTFTGANIVLNSNAAAPFQSGYRDYLGVGASDSVYRAVTLIHELGHAAAIIYGASASQILDDQNNGAQSRANSQLVYDNCFK
jgi:hypothetical protein